MEVAGTGYINNSMLPEKLSVGGWIPNVERTCGNMFKKKKIINGKNSHSTSRRCLHYQCWFADLPPPVLLDKSPFIDKQKIFYIKKVQQHQKCYPHNRCYIHEVTNYVPEKTFDEKSSDFASIMKYLTYWLIPLGSWWSKGRQQCFATELYLLPQKYLPDP